MSLDDLINADRSAKSGKGGGAMRRNAGRGGRDRSAPYSRGGSDRRPKDSDDDGMERRGRGNFMYGASGGGGGGGGGGGAGGILPRSSRDTTKCVYVGNLAWSVEWRDLKDHLGSAGEVQRVDIATRSDGKSRGFAIVQFATEKDVAAVIETFNETEYAGRTIMVREDNGESQVGKGGGGKGGGGKGRGIYGGGGDAGEDDGYSGSGRTGRNGWVKPEATSFVDDGPPPEPKSMLR